VPGDIGVCNAGDVSRLASFVNAGAGRRPASAQRLAQRRGIGGHTNVRQRVEMDPAEDVGSALRMIDELLVASSIPIVVFERTTHL
jgi:hypothetical protein